MMELARRLLLRKERPSSPFVREREQGLTSWMGLWADPNPSMSTERIVAPMHPEGEMMTILFKGIIPKPIGYSYVESPGKELIESMLDSLEEYEPLFDRCLNRLSTKSDAVSILLEAWSRKMGSGWVLGKDGLARAAFEHSESWIFHIGHLHRTIFWDMVRFIMGNAVRCGIACMEIEHLASSTEENLMNEFYEFDGVDGEEERAEFLKNHIKKARSQCWMKDWWWKAIKEIWSFHDKDLAMSRLPKRIHKRTERLIRMLEDYDLRITMNNLDAKCSEFFANEDYMHESCCAQIVWGQDDSILLEELDHWVDSIYSGMSIYSHVELCRPDAEKVMVTESTIDQLKERERIRKEIALWLREATRIQRSRSASRRARSSTRGRRPNQG